VFKLVVQNQMVKCDFIFPPQKEEVKTESRKKNLIILILHWLTEEG
jgi:hypothetical protein